MVIVGSGAGGAVAATVLAEAGLEVVVLEAGPYLDRDDYPEEPLAALVALYRDGGLTVAQGRPAIPTPVGRAVGGTTVINSGTCFRTPEPVLDRWVADHGIDWAAHLDADYAEAEEMLAVQAVDPEAMGRNGRLLLEGAERLGVSHGPLRRNAGACVQCSSCPLGCRLDAKRAMHVTYLPRAVAAGARIRAGVEARELIFDGRRARGVRCRAGTGVPGAATRPFEVRARKAVILAGGAFGTPELLLRSGFRSPGGALGRNLRIHPACWVGARFEDEVRGWEGVMQSYAVDEWEDRGLLLEATFTPLAFGGQWLPGTGAEHQRRLLEFGNLASTGVHLSDKSAGRVGLGSDGSLRIGYQLTREDADRLRVRHRPRRGALLRRRGDGGLPPDLRHSDPAARADRRARSVAPAPARDAARGLSPDGHRAHGRRSAPGRDRAGRGRPRRRGALRRRRQPAAELDRGEPDDDDHRDGLAGGATGRRAPGLVPLASPRGRSAQASVLARRPETAAAARGRPPCSPLLRALSSRYVQAPVPPEGGGGGGGVLVPSVLAGGAAGAAGAGGAPPPLLSPNRSA